MRRAIAATLRVAPRASHVGTSGSGAVCTRCARVTVSAPHVRASAASIAGRASRAADGLRWSSGWVRPRSGATGSVHRVGPSSGLVNGHRLTPAGIATRSIFIKVEETPNPDSMKFVPEDTEVLPAEFGGGQMYTSLEQAKGAYVVRRIIKLPGVTGVYLGRDFISVNKEEDVEWMELKPLVFGAIMDALNSGKPLVEHVASSQDSTTFDEEDDEIVAMIKELLETRIRPAVQEDGGDIFYEGFEDGIVKVRLAGSCQGCPSSTQTLKHGVEAMLQHYIPEVEGVEPVEDEALNSVNDEAFRTLEERLAAAGVPRG